MKSVNANLWLHVASDNYGPVPFKQAVAAVRIAESDAEQRAVAGAAAMFCPYRSGKRCDHTEKPCDHKCELMDKFRADMRNFQNADYWVEDDELAQKVEKANARIKALLKNGKIKPGCVITDKNPTPSPGSWSEHETTLKTSQNEKAE